MSFYEYIFNFNKIKRENDFIYMVCENDFLEYKIGDVVITNRLDFSDVDNHIFVIIEENNIAIPIDYLYFLFKKDNVKNIDFVYQINDKKIIKKIGYIDKSVISDYKKHYILLNRGINDCC